MPRVYRLGSDISAMSQSFALLIILITILGGGAFTGGLLYYEFGMDHEGNNGPSGGGVDTQKATPTLAINTEKTSDLDYRAEIIITRMKISMDDYKYVLQKPNGQIYEIDFVAIVNDTNVSGSWKGVDVTWDGRTDQRGRYTGKYYSDSEAAQARIDEVKAGEDAKGKHISVSYHDQDEDAKLTAGDYFFIKGNEENHTVSDNYQFGVSYIPTLEFAAPLSPLIGDK